MRGGRLDGRYVMLTLARAERQQPQRDFCGLSSLSFIRHLSGIYPAFTRHLPGIYPVQGRNGARARSELYRAQNPGGRGTKTDRLVTARTR